MKRKLLLFISVLMSLLDLYAQGERICTDYDFSPQAFSMIKNGSIQPDLNTGTLNITVPVYVWEDEDFRIPIQLYYSTNGFKPARQTGVVGMDWSCSVGGVITRQIVGIDDFNDTYGYYNRNHNYTNEELYKMSVNVSYDNTGNIVNTNRDTNPDVFHFHFLNHSGSFVIDDDGSFKVFDSNGERGSYDITYTAGSNKKFTIKTGDGYEYHFGSSYSSKEVLYLYNPLSLILNLQGNVSLGNDGVSVIAWHLDKIVAPNKRQLTFSYTSQSPNNYRACPDTNDLVCTTFARGLWAVEKKNDPQSLFYIYKYPSITTVSYINDIKFHETSSAGGQVIVSFDYSQKQDKEIDTSEDNTNYTSLVTIQKKLDKISFFNHDHEPLGELSLSYIYNNSRMLLDQINVSNVGIYKLTYNIDNEMPGILTNAQDFWGFYNGKTENDDEDIDPTTLNDNLDESVFQNFMNPNSVYSKLGTLKSITYPTGGRTEFEYEANTADQILLRKSQPSDNSLDPFLPSLVDFDTSFSFQECGGVRIKSISDYSDTTLMYRRTYSYNIPGTNKSSGIVLKFNKYHNLSADLYSRAIIHLNFPDNSFDKLHMAYSYVTEQFLDGSHRTYRFTDYLMHPDQYSSYKKNNGYNVEYLTAIQDIFMNNIFREPDSRHYRRGLIKSIEDYDATGGLLFKKEYEYSDSDNSYSAYIVGSGKYYWSARRFTCDYLIKNIKETDYRNGVMVTNHKFTYNLSGQKIYEAILDNTNKNGKGKYYRYCHENSLYSASDEQKNLPSDIVLTAIRNGSEYVTDNIELIYDPDTHYMQPTQIKKYCIDSPISIGHILMRNSIINLGRSNSSVSTSFTYNNLHRLTTIVSAGNRYVSYTWDSDFNNIIQKRVNDPSQIYEYTWKDMVGLTSVEEPSGSRQTYQYDSLNRLEIIKNSQNKTTHRYFYHISNN